MRRSKYGSVRTRGFASKAEARYAQELRLREKAEDVKDITEQPTVTLIAGIVYRPDFLFYETGSEERPGRYVYAEVKGVETAVFKLKKRLWRVFGPGLLRIMKASGRGFVVAEEIEGAGASCYGGSGGMADGRTQARHSGAGGAILNPYPGRVEAEDAASVRARGDVANGVPHRRARGEASS